MASSDLGVFIYVFIYLFGENCCSMQLETGFMRAVTVNSQAFGVETIQEFKDTIKLHRVEGNCRGKRFLLSPSDTFHIIHIYVSH